MTRLPEYNIADHWPSYHPYDGGDYVEDATDHPIMRMFESVFADKLAEIRLPGKLWDQIFNLGG